MGRAAPAAVLAGLTGACAVARPPAVTAALTPPAPTAPPRLEKVREPLEVTPLELHFSGLRGASKASETVAVRNTGADAAQITDIRVVGTDPGTFKIVNSPFLPAILAPGRSLAFAVEFSPGAAAEPGVRHARVRILRPDDEDGPPCDLTGLVTRSARPADEPPLQEVLDALGYEVDVGSKALKLPSQPSPLGDEVTAALFERAKPGNVGYYLIARYDSEQASSYGYYLLERGRPVAKPIGSVAKDRNQTLNPELENDSQTSFDPGTLAFGLYLRIGKRTFFSVDDLNGRLRSHVARVFPLRSRGRTTVQDAYVVAFDDDGDGDFQDHVFMLWNAKLAGEGKAGVETGP